MSTTSITPIFNKLRAEGGTFYTFQPAMKDITLMFSNDSNIKFNFSKFVCLKLPEWENKATQTMYIDPNELESVNDNSALHDANTFFVKRFLQNYAENLNTILDDVREDDSFANTAEMSLWKALMLGQTSDSAAFQIERTGTFLDASNVTRGTYTEVKTAGYEQLVQYIGDINMMNHVKADGQEYVEVFAHIPTEAGKISNLKFIENKAIKTSLAQVPSTSAPVWIQGQQTAYETSNRNTFAKAVYDTTTRKYDLSSEHSRLQIHWDDVDAVSTEVKQEGGNFEFNAVLVYYDIFDKSKQSEAKRNLYGIFLLDAFDTKNPLKQHIPTFTKYMPDDTQSGNSYGFRFNLMFSNSSNIVTTVKVINSYSTYSMELYMAALEQLKRTADSYDAALRTVVKQQQTIDKLERQILSLQTYAYVPQAITAAKNANEAAEIARTRQSWTAVERYVVIDSTRIVKQLVDYTAGTGDKPTANINMYYAANGFTDDPMLALNFK